MPFLRGCCSLLNTTGVLVHNTFNNSDNLGKHVTEWCYTRLTASGPVAPFGVPTQSSAIYSRIIHLQDSVQQYDKCQCRKPVVTRTLFNAQSRPNTVEDQFSTSCAICAVKQYVRLSPTSATLDKREPIFVNNWFRALGRFILLHRLRIFHLIVFRVGI